MNNIDLTVLGFVITWCLMAGLTILIVLHDRDNHSKVMEALTQNRAIESEGRCYKLYLPKGDGDG